MNKYNDVKNKGRFIPKGVSTFLFFLAAAFHGCSTKESPSEYRLPDSVKLKSGDLVFRAGHSRESFAVRSLDYNCDYTHVGVVLYTDEGWRVLHAVPNECASDDETDSVKLEPVGVFFRSDRAIKGAVCRYPLSADDTLRMLSAGLSLYYDRHPLFDNLFNTGDSNAYYCTELVWFLYSKVLDVDLSEGRRHNLPLFRNLIFCSDIFENKLLEEVYSF